MPKPADPQKRYDRAKHDFDRLPGSRRIEFVQEALHQLNQDPVYNTPEIQPFLSGVLEALTHLLPLMQQAETTAASTEFGPDPTSGGPAALEQCLNQASLAQSLGPIYDFFEPVSRSQLYPTRIKECAMEICNQLLRLMELTGKEQNRAAS